MRRTAPRLDLYESLLLFASLTYKLFFLKPSLETLVKGQRAISPEAISHSLSHHKKKKKKGCLFTADEQHKDCITKYVLNSVLECEGHKHTLIENRQRIAKTPIFSISTNNEQCRGTVHHLNSDAP